ncbi:PEP-CTERM/exosortase system-associated acyltransferase [Aquisalimonas sp.]|uniref:PEP-CTERM/exosortase system-associated acyltransferase n=1 Tax=Aquisalimonas sp. TaxID=1872621 RepID=UPI0025BABA1B|nr:PEP-CTERM/exosortase system-associated acyltransferase [Aquisalimonas sp.]
MNNLSAIYHESLLAQCAQDPGAVQDALRLRYQVYCLERGYEDYSRFPDHMETDEYDDAATHVLVRNRSDGTTVGTSRLVFDDGHGLPIRTHGSRSVEQQLARTRQLNPSCRIAEVSRFAVTRTFSTLMSQQQSVMVSSRHVTMGLVALLFRQSWESGVTHWTALLNAALIRFFTRVGIHFQPIGPVINHRGARQPVMASLDALWSGVKAEGTALARLAEQLVEADAGRSDPRRPVRGERRGPAPMIEDRIA